MPIPVELGGLANLREAVSLRQSVERADPRYELGGLANLEESVSQRQ